jgi:hypothetical protein
VEEAPSPLALREETTTSTTAAPSPEQLAANDEVRRQVADAVDQLLAADSVEVSYRGQDETTALVGSVTLDLLTGNYHAEETEEHATGAVVSSEHVLVADTLHVRFRHSEGSIDDIEFTPVELVAGRQDFVDETLTMIGRAGASLARIVRYLEEVPFETRALDPASVDGRPAVGHQVRFRAADISSFLRQEDLELIGPSDPPGETVYEFWIDEQDGHLSKVAIGGTHFQDGEALDGFGGDLVYIAGPQITISNPS